MLSVSLGDDAACGPNLEYDLDFQALETAARDKPDQEFGKGNVIAGEEADWKDVHERALALCQRTRDLRVAVLLSRALTRLEGLPGLGNGLDLIASLLERQWDCVHPQPDPEEPDDQMVRMNVLAILVDPTTLGRDIRKAAYMSTRVGGTVSVRQLEVGLGIAEKAASDDEPMPRAQLEGMLREAAKGGLTNGAQAALSAIDRISEVLKQKVDVQQRADLRPLVARLKIMAQLDIAERRHPQDGKIRFRVQDKQIELRVATIPTVYGNEDVAADYVETAQDAFRGHGQRELDRRARPAGRHPQPGGRHSHARQDLRVSRAQRAHQPGAAAHSPRAEAHVDEFRRHPQGSRARGGGIGQQDRRAPRRGPVVFFPDIRTGGIHGR